LGEKRTPLILHNSPSGAIERVIYGLLEKAAREQKLGRPPALPVWLSPSQIRLIPVASRFDRAAEELADEFKASGIRADIDDREESVAKRIRSAEKEWIPYILVIGEREELDQTKLSVRIRSSGETVELSKELLTKK